MRARIQCECLSRLLLVVCLATTSSAALIVGACLTGPLMTVPAAPKNGTATHKSICVPISTI